jgi:undecaprenyl diphosphate synthase
MQSALHVAIIMDGNGRWATRRGLPRGVGHREGAKAVRRIVRAAPRLGIRTLTLYAFSADNWKRPAREVGTLMRIFRAYLAAETATCVQNGVRLGIIGRRDRLPDALLAAIASAEEATRGGELLDLRIAVDYSAQEAVIGAAERSAAARHADGAAPTREEFGRLIDQATHAGGPTPPVDLLIRTGGEQRLSDFLLWETAYAELYFTPAMWPDFQAGDLRAALADFAARERRFGGLPAQAAS